MIEQLLADFLHDDADIRDRVGARIFPGRAVRGTKGETIIIQEITGIPTYTLDLEAGIAEEFVQVDCYAASPRSAYTLKELVRDRVSGYRGTIGNTDPAYVESVRIVGGGQEDERPTDSSDQWIHRYRLDLALFVTTSIPSHA